MNIINMSVIFFSNVLSWEKSSSFIFKLQKRLFKSVYVKDFRKSFSIQKLILSSNSARLLAIREITQVSYLKKIAGIDGKTSLTFIERFQLNENLKNNFQNWIPQSLKQVNFVSKDELNVSLKIPTISDRVWQFLIKLAVEPAHQAVLDPRFFGLSRSVYEIQNTFLLNLGLHSFGLQKRVLKLQVKDNLVNYDCSYLVNKIIAPRSIKLGIFRTLKKGVHLSFLQGKLEQYSFFNLLSDILLDGVENFGCCVRFSNIVIFFLKPSHDEVSFYISVQKFLHKLGLNGYQFSLQILSVLRGFDFLYWSFKVSKDGNFICTPSFHSYKIFLKRIKRIINNSNYGSDIKVSKLLPIIKDWNFYHKYSNLKGSRFSLFYIKRRCLKLFNKEAKQDFYSSKRLVDFCFSKLNSFDINTFEKKTFSSPYFGHLIFWNNFSFRKKEILINSFYCIHCGMNFSFE